LNNTLSPLSLHLYPFLSSITFLSCTPTNQTKKVTMKLIATIAAVLAAASMVTAQTTVPVTSPMKNYNVTSPIQNGPYVAGQTLPCTYQILTQDTTGLQISITLSADPAANFTAVTIISSADVSTTQQFAKTNGNVTFWEHQVNYPIPATTPAGPYYVTFLSIDTNTKLVFNITIRPQAPAASSTLILNPSGGSVATSSGSSSASTSVPPNRTTNASGLSVSVSKTVLALVGVAAFVVTLF
ncbi:hypothetical protein BC936DRAFT_140938, partial [Jimgerdemannia flammicorona]